MAETIRTETAIVWLDETGIAHVESRGVASTAATVEATIAAVESLLKGRRAPLIFDARRWPSSDTGGWVRFISLIETVCLAGAVIIDPEQPADLGHYPDFVAKLLIPFTVVTEEAHAIAFLQPYVELTP